MKQYAVDFESYYDSEYSLSKMTVREYLTHEKFNAYLVSVYGEEGEIFVGDPADFDWMSISNTRLIMHNANFDLLVIARLQELGIIPAEFKAADVVDTADLAAFLRISRDLKSASKFLLGRELSKETRESMKGLTYKQALVAGKADELFRYAASDAKASYDIWGAKGASWPDAERRISKIAREAGMSGVYVDRERVRAAVQALKKLKFEVENQIPWALDAPILSPAAMRAQGRLDGIPTPGTFDKKDPDVAAWVAAYKDKFPWVEAIGRFRSVNTLLQKFEAIERNTTPDGVLPVTLKYFGGATGRFSGGNDYESEDKFNIQNLPKDDLGTGHDMRACFIARPGHTFVIADYNQIEAITLLWRVKDNEMLDLVRGGMNLYEAHARATMGWTGGPIKEAMQTDERVKRLYGLAKARVLGLGFGCGKAKFVTVAKIMGGIDLTPEEAEETVNSFRRDNHRITNHWREHHKFLTWSTTAHDPTHIVELPSRRELVYFNPEYSEGGNITAEFFRGARRRKLYGGILTENEIQATARDLLVDGWLRLVDHGFTVRFTVHDEFVVEVPEKTAAESAKEIERLLTLTPDWAAGLPVGVSIDISPFYRK